MGTVAEELNERFHAYCEAIEGAERIDHLPMTRDQRTAKKADFFFEKRRIVCEIKSLETETTAKLVAVLRAAGLSLEAGTHELTRVLAGRDDEEALYRKCLNVITTAISDGVADANRQIRETKRLFGVDDADGLLVFLHGRVHVLNPDVIMQRIGDRLAKKEPDGTAGYPHITEVVLFSEIHKLKFTDGTMASAAIPVRHAAVPEKFDVSDFAMRLIDGWADWNGRTKHVISAADLR